MTQEDCCAFPKKGTGCRYAMHVFYLERIPFALCVWSSGRLIGHRTTTRSAAGAPAVAAAERTPDGASGRRKPKGVQHPDDLLANYTFFNRLCMIVAYVVLLVLYSTAITSLF